MRRIAALAALATPFVATAPAGAYTVTSFGASQWGASDTTLGIAGYTIENFEDTTLAPGLQFGRRIGNTISQPLSSTLNPGDVFDPTTDPEVYSGVALQVFTHGLWDGTHLLVNNPGPTSIDWYNTSTTWGPVEFAFTGGATSVGFSLGNAERGGDIVSINNGAFTFDLWGLLSGVTSYNTVSGITYTARNGYIRIDAGQGQVINDMLITSGNTDGYAIDHLAFAAVRTDTGGTTDVPESASASLLAALPLLGWIRRRRRA